MTIQQRNNAFAKKMENKKQESKLNIEDYREYPKFYEYKHPHIKKSSNVFEYYKNGFMHLVIDGVDVLEDKKAISCSWHYKDCYSYIRKAINGGIITTFSEKCVTERILSDADMTLFERSLQILSILNK